MVHRVNGVVFDYSNKDSLQLIGIEQAMKDAGTEAEKALSGTEYKVKGIRSINIHTAILDASLDGSVAF